MHMFVSICEAQRERLALALDLYESPHLVHCEDKLSLCMSDYKIDET